MDEVKKYLKEKYNKPGNVFLGLVHRLDRPVSGIILFAKTSKGAARLSEQFRNRTVKKIYHAVVKGKIKPLSGALVHHLQKNEIENKSEVVKEGDLAELCYKTLKSGRKYSLLKIELKTGRFHQIRVQLAVTGYPIVGDAKYGSKEKIDDGSILLSATEITFKTATTGEISGCDFVLRSEAPKLDIKSKISTDAKSIYTAVYDDN